MHSDQGQGQFPRRGEKACKLVSVNRDDDAAMSLASDYLERLGTEAVDADKDSHSCRRHATETGVDRVDVVDIHWLISPLGLDQISRGAAGRDQVGLPWRSALRTLLDVEVSRAKEAADQILEVESPTLWVARCLKRLILSQQSFLHQCPISLRVVIDP